MARATLLNLKIYRSNNGTFPASRLDLTGTVIHRNLDLQETNLQELLAQSLRVEGAASLADLTIQDKMDLRHSHFLTLTLSAVPWFLAPHTLLLDGMTYQDMNIGSGGGKDAIREHWKELLSIANKAVYSASVYSNLETFLRQRGYIKEADAVFIAKKQRERRNMSGGWLHSFAWWNNMGLEYLVGYGRLPELVVIWGALVVLIGVLVFCDKNRMEPRNNGDAARPYSPFWYSIDLFAPVINLEVASVWRPKDIYWWRLLYMRVQKILGWLLVPLGVAAWTGILK